MAPLWSAVNEGMVAGGFHLPIYYFVRCDNIFLKGIPTARMVVVEPLRVEIDSISVLLRRLARLD